MSREIIYRPAEAFRPSDPWKVVSTAEDIDRARDELASWQGPGLSHGDLVIVTYDDLYVFDGDRSAFVVVPRPHAKRYDFWRYFWEEGDSGEQAKDMLLLSEGVDVRRLALAASEIAEMATPFVPRSDKRPAEAIEATRGYVAGSVPIQNVIVASESARRAAREAETEVYGADRGSMALVRALARGGATGAALAASLSIVDAKSAPSFAARASVEAGKALTSRLTGDYRRAAFQAEQLKMADIVRRWIPLSVVACATAGIRDPLPIPRDNPRKHGR